MKNNNKKDTQVIIQDKLNELQQEISGGLIFELNMVLMEALAKYKDEVVAEMKKSLELGNDIDIQEIKNYIMKKTMEHTSTKENNDTFNK